MSSGEFRLVLLSEEGPIIEKLVSGGQTGVDRAALDVAVELLTRHHLNLIKLHRRRAGLESRL